MGLPALGLGQPGRILTASAIYTPFDGSSTVVVAPTTCSYYLFLLLVCVFGLVEESGLCVFGLVEESSIVCVRFGRGKLPRITEACGNRLFMASDDSGTRVTPKSPTRRNEAPDGPLRGRERLFHEAHGRWCRRDDRPLAQDAATEVLDDMTEKKPPDWDNDPLSLFFKEALRADGQGRKRLFRDTPVDERAVSEHSSVD